MDQILQPELDAPEVGTAHQPATKEMVSSISNLLTDCVKAMTLQPSAVFVQAHCDQDTITFCITVADDDLGRVVGRQGAAIQALRAIAKVANHSKHKISLKLVTKGDKEI